MSNVFRSLWAALCLAAAAPAAEPSRGFAFVELYTSEGCSSCPPADEVFAALAKRQEQGEPIYCLGFHIDYWDRLGWKDPFSSESSTRRQIAYCQHFEGREVYTPQMVVNGTIGFLGSDASVAEREVARVLKIRARRKLALTALPPTAEREIEITYRTAAGAKDLDVGVALVQRHGESQVERGENSGRRLTHVAIVRTFRTQPLNAEPTGTVRLTIPADVEPAELEIVGWIQDPKTAEFAAAARIAVAPAPQGAPEGSGLLKNGFGRPPLPKGEGILQPAASPAASR